MRLSEAIRLGSLTIQNPQPYATETCAIGMGLCAIGKHHLKGTFFVDVDKRNYRALAKAWPWVKKPYDHRYLDTGVGDYVDAIITLFDDKVMEDKTMTLEALCDIVSGWERDLASRGTNVEQVTMAATPEATHEPAAEQTKKVLSK